ncbi:hypothetical protein [Amycolatopsis samaneae]|uniref:IrrE N-terminal-like domain-containing protein n=1 Tax=Amycolatopsis samaneae TaxID=664691 RepID=A0ABW5GLS9_9PSEU
MKERVLRRQCRRLLRELDIQAPLDVRALCDRLARHRGRPIKLVDYPLPVPGEFGVWFASDTTDYVLYQRETTKTHQDHIILHEVGHIIAGHSSDETDDALLQRLYPDIAPDVVRRALLRRTHYDADQEREAETVATIILEWASVINYVAPQVPGGRALQTALNGRRGWL